MDHERIDPIPLAATDPHSRRGLLRLLLAGALATGAERARAAAAKGRRDKPKSAAKQPDQDGGKPARGRARTEAAAAPPNRPFPQHVAYAAGTIRPNHLIQDQLDDDVRAAYDRWKQRYLVRVKVKAKRKHGRGKTLYRVALGGPGRGAHARTVSEGQGYGMVIVPLMAGYDPNAQKIFDGLWRFALKYRSCVDDRLMLWIVPNRRQDGCVNATDGDLDIAYGLLLADAQWGSSGAIDYGAAARQVLAGVLAANIGPQSRLPLLGDWVDPNGADLDQWTARTSDFMPGHFRAFRRATGDGAWQDVLNACQDVVRIIQRDHSPATGLLPEFVKPVSAADHTPEPATDDWAEEGGNDDGDYGSNACRVPWRLGVDALLSGDATSRAQAQKISRWIEGATGGDPLAIRYGYHLDGTPLPDSDFFMTSFGAPFGVAAMTDSGQQTWLNALYDAVVANPADYYEDSIALLCLLAMTGNFWDPTA